jgi:tetratricopeptide (TPR) repeat protein
MSCRRLNRQSPFVRELLIICAALSAGILSGCTHLSSHGKTSGLQPLAPADNARFEQHVDALAHFATAVSDDLNDKPHEATAEYLEAANDDLTNEALTLDVARRLIREKNETNAIVLLKKASEQKKASGNVFALLGLAYLQTGQTNLAVEANQQAVKRAPDSLAAYQNLAALKLQAGRTNEAVSILRNAASRTNAPPEFLLGLADLLGRFNRQQLFSDAETKTRTLALLDAAAAQNPENPIILQRIADLYLVRGEIPKAEPIYERLLKRYPSIPGLRERLANIYLRTDKNAAAAKLLEDIRRDNPTDPSTYFYLGSIAYEKKDYDKAAENYETALKLNPEFEPFYYELAGVQIARQQPEEALALLEKARSKFKLNFVLEFYSGVALSMLEKWDEAVAHLTSAELIAKTAEPDRLTHTFYYQLGSAYERSGNIPEAVKALRKALELAPDDGEALNYLGYMWAERGENLDEARSMIERALKGEPENAAFLDSMAWVLFKLHQSEQALTYMQRAIARSEKPDPTLFEHLGDIQLGLKEPGRAREAYEKSLALKADDKVKQKLDALAPR